MLIAKCCQLHVTFSFSLVYCSYFSLTSFSLVLWLYEKLGVYEKGGYALRFFLVLLRYEQSRSFRDIVNNGMAIFNSITTVCFHVFLLGMLLNIAKLRQKQKGYMTFLPLTEL